MSGIIAVRVPKWGLLMSEGPDVARHGFGFLKAPIEAVNCPHAPSPFSPSLGDA